MHLSTPKGKKKRNVRSSCVAGDRVVIIRLRWSRNRDQRRRSDVSGDGGARTGTAELADVLHDALGHAVALVAAGALRAPCRRPQ